MFEIFKHQSLYSITESFYQSIESLALKYCKVKLLIGNYYLFLYISFRTSSILYCMVFRIPKNAHHRFADSKI